jgi:non-ribosomal peptide synthase protein (TIGR01720 family)
MCIKKNAGLLNPVESEVVCKVLEEPANSDLELDNEFIPPKTEMEHFLVKVWAELFHHPQVGTQDNFFDLGGHSLLASQLTAKIYQRYQVELSVQKIYEIPTVFGLAKEIDTIIHSISPDKIAEAQQPPKSTFVTGVVPLTPAQAWYFNIWDNLQIQPDRLNISRLFEVNENFDVANLRQALNYLWKIHDILRARFVRRGDDRWKQIIAGPEQSSPDFREYNLADISVGNEKRTIEEYAELLHGSINITQGPLMITAYLNFGPQRPGRVILIAHHLLFDANAMATFIKDLQIVHRQLQKGHKPDLPEKTVTIKEWAELLQEYILSERHLQTIDYWLERPWGKVPDLPFDYPQNRNQNFFSSIVNVTAALTEAETIILTRRVPLALHLKLEDVLLWALTKVISEWTGSKLVEIRMAGNGHDIIPDHEYVDLSRTLGWISFGRILMLENIESDNLLHEIASFCGQLKKIPDNGYGYLLAAYLNDDAQVAKQLRRIRTDKILFNYQGLINQVQDEGSGLKLVQMSCGFNSNPQSLSVLTLIISGNIINHRMTFEWRYSYNLFRRETIEKLAGKYIRILKELIPKLVD